MTAGALKAAAQRELVADRIPILGDLGIERFGLLGIDALLGELGPKQEALPSP